MAQPIIQVQEVNKEYGKGKNTVAALKDVNIEIQTGEFVAIVGPSGCGKSTLLHVMAGLEHPTLLRPEHFFQRTGAVGAQSCSELFTTLAPGELLAGTDKPIIARYWDMAQAESFTPIRSLAS